ncbi:uncharacterized protein LOC134672054, partial [Cydia fagiglandana]|uniref:uncharacterized protein LOC134672054 n=1 Tax=Cydia fagiglandana TaxID=1458189 RepID=UPI002FEE4DA2
LSSGSSIILYGSKGWTFPEQDVNLTLSYPTSDTEIRRNIDNYVITGYEVLLFTDGTECAGSIASGGLIRLQIKIEKDYVITGYLVILFTDGLRGGAYIQSGGILQDTISLTFISEGITTLSYQFWLYGAQRSSIPAEEYNYVMC